MTLPIALGYVSDGTVRTEFLDSVARLLQRHKIKARISVRSGPRIAANRNNVIKEFLKNTEAEYLWMVDTDMVFKPEVPQWLLAHDLPLVGALAYTNDDCGDVVPVIYEGYPPTRMTTFHKGLVKCSATGAACLLMRRDLLLEMGETGPLPHPWFQETVVDEAEIGEDITFCLRAKDLCGVDTYVDTSTVVGHVKEKILYG